MHCFTIQLQQDLPNREEQKSSSRARERLANGETHTSNLEKDLHECRVENSVWLYDTVTGV